MKQVSKATVDYFGIVKKAFILPWKYRFLFWLGVLASFAAGGELCVFARNYFV